MTLAPERARDLVEHFGSRRAAGRALGVSEATLRYWLDPELKRERVAEHYHGLSGVEYNRRLLQIRRISALARLARRDRRVALNG